MDDSSDILGGQLNVARPDTLLPWFTPSFTGLLFIATIAVAAFYGLQFLGPHIRLYQEKRYRKSMRRRHGIPDHDHRPFNVAYAAAKRAQREREAEEKGQSKRSAKLPPGAASTGAQQHGSSASGQATRQRPATGPPGQPSRRKDTEEFAQPPVAYVESRRPSGQTTTASESDFQITGVPHEDGNENLVPKASLYAPAFTRPAAGAAKRGLDEEDTDTENQKGLKKSRVDGQGMMDGEDAAEWEGTEPELDDDMEVDEASPVQPRRVAKRMASLEEDEGFESSRAIGRDKRARKVSGHEPSLRVMRGKKRDRTEAGSTFGDSVADDEGDKHRSQRRRRLITNKRSVGNLRGRKRGREPDSMESGEESDSPSKRAARHKRGKRSPREDEWSSDDGMVSNDPLCKGRQIGEEWESNGVKYKVGPNGQRLREALVKKSRSRFPMPKDSEHPDRKANIDVYVETWLSEEEYQLAKERNELAWQSPQNATVELPSEVPDSPSKGKNLLWSSTAHKDGRQKAPLLKSLAVTAGHRLNPFQPAQSSLGRRISTLAVPVPAAPESPKLRSSRSYSKWEKQDLEAEAMSKLRNKVKQDSAPPEKKPVATATPAPANASAPAPVTATAKPGESSNAPKPAEAPKATTFTFGPAATAVPPTKASTSDLPSLSIPSAAPKPAEAPKASTSLFPSAPSTKTSDQAKTTAAAPAPSTSTFSFGKPSGSQPPANAPSSSSSVPNFFAKPGTPASATAGSAFGTTSQPTAPAATQSSSSANIFGSTAQTKPTAATSTPSPNLFGTPAAQSSTGQTKPSFSFGAPSADASKKAEGTQPAAAPTSAGPSLLARMGGFNGNAAGSSTTSQPSAPASAFSFGKPAAPAAAPAAPASSTSTAASNPAPVKFNFGVKPAATTTPSTSGSSQAPASDASKPANPFTFGSTNTAASSSNTAAAQPVKFGFGAQPSAPASGSSSTPSIFGNTNTNGTSSSPFGAPSTATSNVTATPAKSAFSTAFPKTPANGSAFGTTSTTPAGTPGTSLFGNANAAPSTPANGSAFAEPMSTTPAGTPKPGSIFGNNAASTTPAGPPPAKSTFSFGNAAASGSGTSLFGNTSKPATTPAAPGSSIFGQPSSSTAASQPSTSGASSSKPTFSFAAPATTNGATQNGSAATSTPKFSFGVTSSNASNAPAQSKPSLFGGSSTTGTAFGSTGFGAAATTPAANATTNGQSTQPTPNLFGFGSSTGTSSFAFGQTKPPESGQK